MEFVYVVPRSELFSECAPHGFQPFSGEGESDHAIERSTLVELVRDSGFYVEREKAERTPAWKQIIPYVVVIRRGESDPNDPEIFLLRRTKSGGEKRLHDKLSIGVGGHINPIDSETAIGSEATQGQQPAADPSAAQACRPDPIPAACRRELHEELILEDAISPLPVGILNDDTNPVGAVHVGLVEFACVAGAVSVRETDQLEGTFTRLSHLEAMLEKGAPFETWSALLLKRLAALLSSPPLREALSLDAPADSLVGQESRGAGC